MSSAISIKNAQAQGLVVGLKAVSGVLPRREIDDLLVNDPDVANLFFLALARIMKDENGKQDKMNFFEVAGIHGLPLRNWDGVQNPTVTQKGSYCTHSTFLFPTWHRPYLAMMEQTLYNAISDIAAGFSDPKYKEAAKRFRLPYWDYLKPRELKTTTFPGAVRGRTTSFPYNYDLPLVLTVDQVMVYKPKAEGGNESQLVPIPNPLLTYHFPKIGSLSAGEWTALGRRDAANNEFHASQVRTVRNPRGDSEHDNLPDVSLTLNMVREGSVENVLDFMSKYDTYLDLASVRAREAIGDTTGPAGSLEDLHDTYHGVTGGDGGHMGRVPVAAFDPIFWLHHCNVERIFTVWQALHTGPDSFLPDDDEPNETDYDAKFNLWPFRSSSKTAFWTSADVKDGSTFGYTFPDLQVDDIADRWDQSYRWSLQSNTRTQPPAWMAPVNFRGAQAFRYKSTGTAMAAAAAAAAAAPQQVMHAAVQSRAAVTTAVHSAVAAVVHAAVVQSVAPVVPAVVTQAFAAVIPAALPDAKVPEVQKLTKDAKVDDAIAQPVVQWYVDVKVERDALDGAFTIYFFIGSPESMATIDGQPDTYSTAPIMAGLTKVFTAPREACDACNSNATKGVVVTGTNPVTPMLRDYISNGQLAGLAAEQVVPFLKKHLYWRVVAANVVPHDPATVAGLSVGVSQTLAVYRDGEARPVSWEAHSFPEATQGRTGGDPVAG